MTVPSRLRRGFHAFFFVGLYASYLFTLFFVAYVVDAGNFWHTAARLLVSAIELAFFSAACSLLLHRWLSSRRWVWLVPYLLLATTICFVYVAQIYSIYISDNFISVLAMQNFRYALFTQSTIEWVLLGCGGVWVCLLGINAWWLARAANSESQQVAGQPSRRNAVAVFVVLALLTAGIFTQQRKRITLEPDYRQAPFASLVVNAEVTVRGGDSSTADVPSTFSDKLCMNQPAVGEVKDYPFEKSVVYRDPLPFASTGDAMARPNVIVVLTEGMSARMLGSYGGKYPDLTPNIDRLSQRSMRVSNYYNHTAATFRGLIGQMSSGFTSTGGEEDWSGTTGEQHASVSRQTLTAILSAHDYASYFFEPERNGSAFTRLLEYLGFADVYTFEKISRLLGGDINLQQKTDQLDDGTLFRGLTAFLKSRVEAKEGKPFFLATYNIGTHAFIPMAVKGKGYGEGKQDVLNKIHNYDAAIGSFLDYFYASPYAKNTILIFTTDHATYPEKPYRQVAGKDLKPYFVDKIPLLVYDPVHHLPRVLDARGRNSLDMVPTVLQLLGIRDAPNSFLGSSLFEARSFPYGVSALGDDFYITTPDTVFASWGVPAKLETLTQCEQGVVNTYYKLEKENRLFKPLH